MTRFNPIESLAKARHEFGEHGGVNASIESSVTFTVMRADKMPELFHGAATPEQGCYLYGRHYNPTVIHFARMLAAMEGTEAAHCTASGMGAISGIALQLCDTGDHAVVSRAIYGGTFALFSRYLPKKAGITATFVDVTNFAEIEAAFTPRTRLLYVETLANPTLVVADLPKLAEIAHRHGALLVVDNTFSPLIFAPAQLGADIVVHSLTKFISGGADSVAGAVCGPRALLDPLYDVNEGSLMLLGPTMDPRIAFELSLRVPHLPLRMQEHSRRAQVFAERLEAMGLRVRYPGLPSHPQHELFRALANPEFGAGGIIALDLETSDRAARLMESLQLEERFGFIAVSLGYFDTLMSASATSTSSELPLEDRDRAGLSEGLMRMSVGYTGSLEQRWEQLERAVRKIL